MGFFSEKREERREKRKGKKQSAPHGAGCFDVNSVEIVVVDVAVVVGVEVDGGILADPDLAGDLHLLHALVDHFLHVHGLLDVFELKTGRGLVGRLDDERADPEQALPQIAAQADVADAVQDDLLVLQVKEPGLEEKPVA